MSARLRSGHDLKKDLSSIRQDQRHILLARHIRRTRLRAVAGSWELGRPTCRICRLFTISNIRAAHPKGEGTNLNKIQSASALDGHRNDQRNGGACRDRTDDLKLAKLPLSQLS